MLDNVLCDNPLKTTEVCPGSGFGTMQHTLMKHFDSVEGGPHRPTLSGPYAARARSNDDRIMYVTYHPNQCLTELIITNTQNAS